MKFRVRNHERREHGEPRGELEERSCQRHLRAPEPVPGRLQPLGGPGEGDYTATVRGWELCSQEHRTCPG